MILIPTYPLGQLPEFEPFFEVLRRDAELRRITQAIPYAASITPNAQAGEIVVVDTLTGDLVVNNPIGAIDGARLYFQFTQDSTGGHTVTFGSDFESSWTTSEGANIVSTVNFRYDLKKAKWVQGSMALLALTDGAATVQTGLVTFDRDPLPPFAVTSGSAVVTNLDADKLDGQHGAFYQDAGNLNAGTLLDARVAESNVTQHEAALTILESQITDGSILARVAASETITGTFAFNPASGAPFTTTRTNLVSNLNADLLDGQEGSWYQDADNINMAVLATPAFTTAQHMQNVFHSSGQLTGGALSDVGAGVIDVSAGEGLIRATDSATAELLFMDWPASAGNTVPDGTVRYFGVEYNDGTPQVVVKTTRDFDNKTDFELGSVVREGATLHISNQLHAVGDHANQMIERLFDVAKFARDNTTGGVIVSESADTNRYIAVSTGNIWSELVKTAFAAFDSDPGGGADTFDTYKHVSGTFTITTGVTQWPNTQYDDGTDLVTMTNNRYANLWLYGDPDGEVAMLYGTAQYTSSAGAENEAPPSSLPLRVQEHSFLLGRLIFQKSATTAIEVESVFDTVFLPAQSADHGNLTGLTDDDHTQYILVDGSRNFTGNLLATGAVDLGENGAGAFRDLWLDGDATIGNDVILNSAVAFVQFLGTSGGGGEGILYKDSGAVARYALYFPGSDVVALANRAPNGVVEIRASGIGGGGGPEVTYATFRDDKITLSRPVTVSDAMTALLTLESTVASGPGAGSGIIGASNDGAAQATGDRLGFFLFRGQRDASNSSITVGIVGYAEANWTLTSAPTYMNVETTPSGSINRVGRWRFDSDGHFLALGTQDIGDGASANPRDLYLDGDATIGGVLVASGAGDSSFVGNVLIGTTTPATGSPRLDVVGDDSVVTLVLTDNVTDATSKQFRFGLRHYTNTEEVVAMIFGASNNATTAILSYGGGTGSMNAVTSHGWYTAANSTTVTGTLGLDLTGVGTSSLFHARGDIQSGGDVTIGGAATIGGVIEPGSIFNIEPGVAARDLLTGVGLGMHIEADTWDINAAGNGETVGIGALVYLGRPTWTSVGTTFTITNAATLYIQNAPLASTNVTIGNTYALWVDNGESRFDGGLTVNGVLTLDANLDFVGPQAITTSSGDLSLTPAANLIMSPLLNFINESANTKMTIGLTINQDTNSNECLALKSSTSVAHNMTDLLEEDTYATFTKVLAAAGGLIITGASEATRSLVLRGYHTTDITGKTNSDGASVEVRVFRSIFATVGGSGADANLFAVLDQSITSKFIVDVEGDLFADGGVASTNMVTLFDKTRDAMLCRGFDLVRGRTAKDQLVRTKWDDFVGDREHELIELGILGAPVAEGGLVCITQLQRLHNGAIWQAYIERQELREEHEMLKARLEKVERLLLAA